MCHEKSAVARSLAWHHLTKGEDGAMRKGAMRKAPSSAFPIGLYRRPMPRVLRGVSGVRHFLMGEVPLFSQRCRRRFPRREAPRGTTLVRALGIGLL